MGKFKQFTYAWSTRKCDSNNSGTGIFSRTANSSVDSDVISIFRQDFNDKTMPFITYGYTLYGSTPIFFNACNNTNAIPDDRGPSVFYLAHVNMGEVLIRGKYVIQYCGSDKNYMNVMHIDDSKKPEYYPEIDEQKVLDSTNDNLSRTKLITFQTENIEKLATIANALVACADDNRKVFLIADDFIINHDNTPNELTKWMAAVLTLFPMAIANKISFNTYMPDPYEHTKNFKFCGAVKNCSKNIDKLNDPDHIFYISSNSTSTNRLKKSEFFKMLMEFKNNAELFEKWGLFSDDYTEKFDIKMADLDNLVNFFRFLSGMLEGAEAICFYTDSCEKPLYDQNKLHSRFIEIIDNHTVFGSHDVDLAFTVLNLLRNLLNTSSFVDKASVLNQIIAYMFEQACSHDLLVSVLSGSDMSFEKFMDNNYSQFKEYMLNDDIEKRVINAFKFKFRGELSTDASPAVTADLDSQPVTPNIYFAIYKLYFEKGVSGNDAIALSILKICVSSLMRNSVANKLFDVSLRCKNIDVGKIVLFLDKSINETFLNTDKTTFFDGLITKIKEICLPFEPKLGATIDKIVECYMSNRYYGEECLKRLFMCRWTKRIENISDVEAMYQYCTKYSTPTVSKVFFNCFKEICDKEKQLEKVIKYETDRLPQIGDEDLRTLGHDVRRVKEQFNSDSGYQSSYLVKECCSELAKLLKAIEDEEKCRNILNKLRTVRIDYELKKVNQLSNSDIEQLLTFLLDKNCIDRSMMAQCTQKNPHFYESANKIIRDFLNDPNQSLNKIEVCQEVNRLLSNPKKIQTKPPTDPKIRIETVKIENDLKKIADIAIYDKDAKVRARAANKITNKPFLIYIAENTEDPSVAKTVITKLVAQDAQDALVIVAEKAKYRTSRKLAINELRDKKSLKEIVEHEEDSEVCETAKKRLKKLNSWWPW